MTYLPQDYFPVALCGWDHHAWRLWPMACPAAKVADAGQEPRVWLRPEDLKPCRKVVVGVPGIPHDITWAWTMGDVRPTPDMVNTALVKPATPQVAPCSHDREQVGPYLVCKFCGDGYPSGVRS